MAYVKQVFFILVLGTLLGFVFNRFSPSGISITEFNPVTNNKEEASLENMPTMDLAEAFAYFQEESAVFVDSRPPELFSQGRIEGAFNLPEKEFNTYLPEFLDTIPPDETLIVYCDGQDCLSSLQVAHFLRDAGFTNILVFYGGWQEWEYSGYQIDWD